MPEPTTARPELLSPAGDLDCVRAAVANGADAVYFGLEAGFNARARATNFSLDAVPELMAYLHRNGVLGYVTVNTLVFTDELPEVEATVRRLAEAGVDAVLVQDIGAVRLIRAICPDLAIHASTQMTLTSAETIRVAEELGVQRVVLARELSLEEIEKIHRQTTMPLETFVHGALCVAYSGQCLTSESLGGRSANRGQCAQACRMPYEVVCDGQDVDLAQVKYLLSPQDLAAFKLIPELLRAGVCSFKIEGRLKSPEYVANITRHYRQAIDSAVAGRPVEFTPRQVEEMELSFSRGFSPGWLGGCDHKMLVPGLSSAKRGVFLGTVTAVRGQRVAVQLAGPLKRGDGVVFDGDRAANDEQGGRVFELTPVGRSTTTNAHFELSFGHGHLDTRKLYVGQKLWKTDDPELTSRLRKSFQGALAERRLPVDFEVEAEVGQPLRIVAEVVRLRDATHDDRSLTTSATCEVFSAEPLAAAIKHPLTTEELTKQLGRLGGTNFQLRNVTARITGQPMVPLSVLGQLRHDLVGQLTMALERPPQRRLAAGSALAAVRASVFLTTPPAENAASTLHVHCRTLQQVEAVVAHGIGSVQVDFQDIREYRDAVEKAHAGGATIQLATPRIQKPDEMGIFRALLKHGADGWLVRNFAGLYFCREQGVPFVTDFSLNVTNELTAQHLHELGAQRITASYDLNRDQLLGLVGAVPPAWLEVVAHQHMPMFHMEHCVFCAVLSPGTNKTNCGRPCDEHLVKLRDHLGMEHPLKADVGCRNTLFNAVPQSAAEVVPTLQTRGVRHFRVELLDQSAPSEIHRTLDLYRDLLAGRRTGKEVWTQLNAANRVGVTRGTLEEKRNPLAIL